MTKKIILTFDDPIFPRVVKALSTYFVYTPTIDDGQGNQVPNPQSRQDFLVAELKRWVIHIARDIEISTTTAEARDEAEAAVKAERDIAKAIANELDVTITTT